MKRIALLSAIVLLLVGCGRVQIDENKFEEETEKYKISVSVPVISGLSDEQFEIQMNERFKSDSEKLIAAFKTRVSDQDGELDELKAVPMTYRGKNTISVINDIYEYNGGVHGILSRPCVTVDTVRSVQLSLHDLFIDDKWRDFLNSKLAEMVEQDSEKYSTLWEKPVIMDEQCFYIDGPNLVIYYPPYELSYYARGFVDFEIPISKLEGYIKTEYSEKE